MSTSSRLELPALGLGAFLRDRARTRAAQRTTPRERLVLVGNGMVGHRLCVRLVELGALERYGVVIYGDEATPAYDRVHLTDVLKGRNPDELLLSRWDWYAEQGIELRLSERVTALFTGERRILTESGRSDTYDKLVLATGARARLPNVPVEREGLLVAYRTLDDARRILERLERAGPSERRVVVLGGGLLGIEAARTLQQRGLCVVVLEAASQLMPRNLDPVGAEALLGLLTEAGLDVRLRRRVQRVEAAGAGARVVLEGGEAIDAGLVVAAIGTRAADELARAAGLRCSMHGGVEVNARLRTSDPNVFAVGDCASDGRVPHGLVAPGYAMAEVLAENLVGRRRQFEPEQAVTRLKLDVTEVTILGNPHESTATELVHRSNGVYRRLLVRDRRILGAISIGSWAELPELQHLVGAGRKLPRKALHRFTESGVLGAPTARPRLAVLPDSAVVCQCASVSAGRLRRAVLDGATTPEALGRATLAGTLCGSCRPTLAVLCGGAPSPAPRAGRALGLLGAAALLLAAATASLPRMPLAQRFAERGLDLVWIEPAAKQVTGFTLLGLITIGMVLSVRKRVRRFRFGSYAAFRLLHVILGTTALVALFAHTGFRLGNNLNRLLMVVFLIATTTGALSSLLAHRLAPGEGGVVARLASAGRRLHDYAFWPLPVLIFIHVLKSFYF
ncbi:MAG TPA: FAD-dependent oxidoreductase [Polyangiaceae bacterium]|nr:FAD-dependent oxidoreductase [Polyangiaceae bacterium]